MTTGRTGSAIAIAIMLIGWSSSFAKSPVTHARRANRRSNLVLRNLSPVVQSGGGIVVSGTVINRGQLRAGRASALHVDRIAPDGTAQTVASVNIAPINPAHYQAFKATLPANRLSVSSSLRLRIIADATGQVTETPAGEGDNTREITLRYGPDIAVKQILRLDKATGSPKVIKLSASIKNEGNLSTGTFKGVWLLDERDPVVPTDPGLIPPAARELRTANLSVIPSRTANDTLSYEVKPEQAGKLLVFHFVADPTSETAAHGSVEELDETNNSSGIAVDIPVVPPALPDIVATGIDFTWNPDQSSVTFTPKQKNIGSANSGPFDCQFFRLDRVPGDTNGAILRTPIGEVVRDSGISAGAVEGLPQAPTVTWTPPAELRGKLIQIQFLADSTNLVNEASDGPTLGTTTSTSPTATPADRTVNGPNNTVTLPLFMVRQRLQPDLAVTGVTGQLTNAGRTIQLAGQIVNAGQFEALSFGSKWIVDGVEMAPMNHASLFPGARAIRRTLTVPVTSALAHKGKITVKLVVTSSSNDLNSDNNEQAILQKTTQGPDLAAVEVTITAERSNPNLNLPDQLVVRGRVQNVGDRASGPFDFSLGVDGGPTLDKVREYGLGPGESREYTYAVTPLSAADFGKTFYGVLRVRPAATELVTENNSLKSTEPGLTLPDVFNNGLLADLTVQGIEVTRNGNKATFRALVKNIGRGDSSNRFLVRWFIGGGSPVKATYHPPLAAGTASGEDADSTAATTLEYEPQSSDPNLIDVVVVVDLPSEVVEVDDNNPFTNNNVRHITFQRIALSQSEMTLPGAGAD
jgi:hypothetical protein